MAPTPLSTSNLQVSHEKFPLEDVGSLTVRVELYLELDLLERGKKLLAAALLTSFAISLMAVRGGDGDGKTKAQRHPENDRDNNNYAVHKYFDSNI